ncbi:glycosyltransferase [Sanguibacter antarcticus]|uniref:D-inositol 3-phosphate glycosyltransferase n=1 Tax=Sanguibacter antarcticus TaxID=372484 RepID=A0A2A9E0H0_9MICO|nr:glycosyltransferase [Sanguibacter antarcticus]PFG32334.1 glycosyltransferase involved in cell wall biosynthesis [Sanguibacter antarcticus]
MPRVLVVGHTAAPGGAELALVRLCGALDPSLASVAVLLFEDGPLRARLETDGHEVAVLPLRADVRTAHRDASLRSWSALRGALVAAVEVVRFTARLTHAVRAQAPDVLHATTLKADLLCMVPALLARVPLVWHVHDRIAADYMPAPVAALLRALARVVPRHVVVNSMATAGTLRPPRGRWTLAYPGLLPTQVRPWPERTEPRSPVVGIVGRVGATKGQRELVQAAALVVAHHPQVTFRIIGGALFGEEGYEAEVRSLVGSLGLRGSVRLTGHVDDPVGELDGLSVCVHASPVAEPFGQVVVEAMARGVPVVATCAGGVPEILLADGGRGAAGARPARSGTGPRRTPFGVLVPPGDVAALAAAVLDVLDDPVGARERARAAWLRVQEQFMIDRTCAAVLGAWSAVLSSGPSGGLRGQRVVRSSRGGRRGRPASR